MIEDAVQVNLIFQMFFPFQDLNLQMAMMHRVLYFQLSVHFHRHMHYGLVVIIYKLGMPKLRAAFIHGYTERSTRKRNADGDVDMSKGISKTRRTFFLIKLDLSITLASSSGLPMACHAITKKLQ